MNFRLTIALLLLALLAAAGAARAENRILFGLPGDTPPVRVMIQHRLQDHPWSPAYDMTGQKQIPVTGWEGTTTLPVDTRFRVCHVIGDPNGGSAVSPCSHWGAVMRVIEPEFIPVSEPPGGLQLLFGTFVLWALMGQTSRAY